MLHTLPMSLSKKKKKRLGKYLPKYTYIKMCISKLFVTVLNFERKDSHQLFF